MKNRRIFQRYAEAFMAFAEPRIGMARGVDDMRSLRAVIRENPDLMHFLLAPEVPNDHKSGVLDRVLGESLSAETLTFIKFLLVKRRADLIPGVTEYIRVVYSHGFVVDVVLRTTFPVELPVIERIKTRIEAFSRKKVNLYLELSPELLGGAQVVIGNTIIDGSVRNRLAQLKKQMLSAKVGS